MTAPDPQAYDLVILSEEEKARFLAALIYESGKPPAEHRKRFDGEPLPSDVDPERLDHWAFHYFWEVPPEKPGSFFEKCPIKFRLSVIRTYFEEQKVAYLAYIKWLNQYPWVDKLDAEKKKSWEREFYHEALNEPYSKVWYEFQVNRCIYCIDEQILILKSHTEKESELSVVISTLVNYSAALGRLVEQYFWKFCEKSAIRGSKVVQSAKDGGAERAFRIKAEHARWQEEANLFWKERPASSKTTVASAVKKRLNIEHSPKHIARMLVRPGSRADDPELLQVWWPSF